MEEKKTILSVNSMSMGFKTDYGYLPIMHDIDFDIYAGETLGVVGESGCGKSVTSLCIMRLLDKAIIKGEIELEGRNLLELTEKQMQDVRGNEIAMIFQEPMTSLNPVFTIGYQLSEALRRHQGMNKQQAWARATEMLELVRIADAPQRMKEYPYQLSGGMRQRVMIAMALACRPKLLIADEPTTALDVTIQAQVLELMKDLINNRDMSMLMITHSLGIVAEVCDDMAVMYAGRIVEKGTVDDVFNNMRHPYTEGLFNSLPNLKEQGEMLEPIKGLMPDPADLPPGCTFAPRCPYATEACSASVPELHSVDGSKTHFVACHAYSRPGFALRRNQK